VAPLPRLDADVDAVLEWSGGTPAAALAPQLEAGRFDAAVVLHPKPRLWSPLAAALFRAGIPVRVGSGRRWWGLALYSHRVWATRHRAGRHECWRAREHGRALLRALGADAGVCDLPPRTRLAAPAEAVSRVKELLARESLGSPVLVHASSRGNAADWPLENVAALADRLREEGEAVVLSAGLGRTDLEEALRSLCRRAPRLVPSDLPLPEFAAWLAAARCVVAGSTGPLHLAAALGTPTVGLFPNVKDCLPEQWGPLGDRSANLVAPAPPGGTIRKRGTHPPGHMEGLTVDQVHGALRRQLALFPREDHAPA
jgi:ADP-heptose:LPS heptosyltransferase